MKYQDLITIREVALTLTGVVITNKGEMVEAEVNRETDGVIKQKRMKVFCSLKSIFKRQGLVKGEDSESLKTMGATLNKCWLLLF